MTIEATKTVKSPALPGASGIFIANKKNRLTIVSGERRLLQPGLGLLLILFFGFFFADGFLFLFGGNHGSNILQAIFVVDIHQANALGIAACLANPIH